MAAKIRFRIEARISNAGYVLPRPGNHLRERARKTKPDIMVTSVNGSGVIVTFARFATEKVSLPPWVLVRMEARPIRLVVVARKGLIAAACAASNSKAKPRFPWPWNELFIVIPP